MPKITGASGAQSRLNRLASQEKVTLVGQALVVAGDKIKAEASRLITQNSAAGQSGGKHQHVPSLPGQPPNEEFGTLRRNIDVDHVAPLRVEVSSNAPYSAALEYGTSKMVERPFMGPAARAKRPEVVALVRKAVDAAVRKG